MKIFLYKITIYITILTGLFFIVLSFASGNLDPYYLRFTTPKQNNLILGSSRSAQGILPQILDTILHKQFFNYSFTIEDTPYGFVYLNSIKKKINPDSKESTFILSVDPWALSSSTENPNDTSKFRENNSFIANQRFVNMNPNFEYLIKNLKGHYYSTINFKKRNLFLHKNGWLEVNVPMDSLSISKRTSSKIVFYQNEMLPFYKFSEARLSYLIKTITFLQKHGKVYLIRLPIDYPILKMEDDLITDFDETIRSAIEKSDGYLDLTNQYKNYQYTDGNHLYKKSGEIISKEVAEWIKSLN